MTDDQEQLREHWQQLAEQLGLEPAELMTQEAKEPETPVSPPVVIEDRESKREDRILTPEPVESEESIREFSFSKSEAQPEVVETEPLVRATETEIEESPQPDEIIQEEPRGERRERRGRRSDRGERPSRGRRGSGSRRREVEPPAMEDRGDSLADEDTGEIAESPEETEPALLHETTSSEPDEAEDDVEDVDTLSDWNVPSWTELIGSLYRPER
jgi:hypothetical protein